MRDGMSGLIMWGLAVLLTAVLALGAASTASRQTAPSGGTAGASASVAGETALASELDELFRTDRYIVDPTIEYQRSVAARILLKSSSHTGVPAEDRAYLTTLVRTHTGISIGGVSPIGHPKPLRTLVDLALDDYEVIWAAAGHTHAVFPTTFSELVAITGGTPAHVGVESAAKAE